MSPLPIDAYVTSSVHGSRSYDQKQFVRGIFIPVHLPHVDSGNCRIRRRFIVVKSELRGGSFTLRRHRQRQRLLPRVRGENSIKAVFSFVEKADRCGISLDRHRVDCTCGQVV
ncbi:hypothetical protein Mapa_005999 [Marchantia paleacea]|nr:hypothetical protein Mapa_005999 [Marchantia paleacea]